MRTSSERFAGDEKQETNPKNQKSHLSLELLLPTTVPPGDGTAVYARLFVIGVSYYSIEFRGKMRERQEAVAESHFDEEMMVQAVEGLVGEPIF